MYVRLGRTYMKASSVPRHLTVLEPGQPRIRSDRHRLLLETILDLISAEGIDAVRHRRVAKLAGVPLGSTTYYFVSREDMLEQALNYFADQELAALSARLGTLTG